jgi:biotin---protein ligase
VASVELNREHAICLQVALTVCGLSENGYLKGMDDEGNEFELHPDGNSLDMMQGLIRRKMPA